MRAPPPTAKGVVTIEQIVETLPDRGRSCWHLGAVWALSQFQDNEVRPGLTPSSVPGFYDSGLRLDPCRPGTLTCKAGGTCEVLRPESGWSSEWGGAGGWGANSQDEPQTATLSFFCCVGVIANLQNSRQSSTQCFSDSHSLPTLSHTHSLLTQFRGSGGCDTLHY